MSNQCLHVKIKATPVDLVEMGIVEPDIQKILLSGVAFAVQRKMRADGGRPAVMLICPKKQIDLAWVYEEFTEPV